MSDLVAAYELLQQIFIARHDAMTEVKRQALIGCLAVLADEIAGEKGDSSLEGS